MPSCPTIRIKSDNEDGYCVINASAFDDKVHVLFDPAPVSLPADEVALPDEVPEEILLRRAKKQVKGT